MANFLQGMELRKLLLGERVTKSTGTLAATTISLFTVAGGQCLVTSLYGLVTTSITVANSYKLIMNPTDGDTQDLCAATDIGTTDTLAGSILQFGLATTTAPPKLISVGYGTARLDVAVPIGDIQHTSAGTDGVITWCLTYVPLSDGATIVAA